MPPIIDEIAWKFDNQRASVFVVRNYLHFRLTSGLRGAQQCGASLGRPLLCSYNYQ